jgi:hypothetical protein
MSAILLLLLPVVGLNFKVKRQKRYERPALNVLASSLGQQAAGDNVPNKISSVFS